MTLKMKHVMSFICELMPQLNVLSYNILYINGNITSNILVLNKF